MAKFIIEVNEGETDCKKCPFYSKDLKCSKLVCDNDKIYEFNFLICTDYDLSTLKYEKLKEENNKSKEENNESNAECHELKNKHKKMRWNIPIFK